MQDDDRPGDSILRKITSQELEIKGLKEENTQLRNELFTYQPLEEQKTIEERYIQSQARFRTIFEKSELGNKILASDLTIIEVNASLVSMLGYLHKDEIKNKRIIEFSHPDFIERWQHLQSALWEKRIPSFSIDTCLIKKDGSTLWCRVTSILFDDQEQQLGYTIVEDINERKVLEEKLQRLYEAQEMVMYMVAHDLRNPLHIIQTIVGLLRKDISSKEKDNYLTLIEQTFNRSHTIINDLVLIGELESSPLSTERTDMETLIRSIVDMITFSSMEKEITIKQEFPDYSVFVHVNKEKMARGIENLIANAIKFSNRGGEIKVFLEKQDSFMVLKVVDQGIGIPMSLQPIIFNKFSKAKRKGTEGEITTGLGLFITKRIVEVHQGKIWVESMQNKGTTFCIMLPLNN